MSDKFLAYQRAIARIGDSDGRIWGAGFLVSENYLFTCAHVIIQALRLNQESFLETPKALISLDFPNYPTQPRRKVIERKATVILWEPCLEFFQTKLLNAQPGDDIALLELNEPLSCDELESIVLTPAEDPWDREFRVYGFPSGSNLGRSTTGKLRSLQGRRWVQLKVDANEPPIEGGFSGAPLWDEAVDGVIGMTVAAEKCDPQGNRAREVSFAIPASILQKIWLRQGRLIELLKPFQESLKQPIQKAYNACRPPAWNGEQPTTLAEIVSTLNDLDEDYELDKRDSRQKEYRPLVEFAVRLANCAAITNVLRQDLQTWVELTFELDGKEFARLRDRLANRQTSPQKLDSQSSLLISLDDREVKAQYQIQAWLIENDKTDNSSAQPMQQELNNDSKDDSGESSYYSFSQLASQMPKPIADLLDEVFDKIENELQIEVFVPFDILHLAPDSWEYEMKWDCLRPIGYHCPVVLRVWDRLGYKELYPKRLTTQWQKRWKRQKEYESHCCSQVLVCSDRADDEIYTDWATEIAIGLRKTKTPNPGKGGLFTFIMVEGVPIALWLRKDFDRCCNGEKYQELLDAPLSELPQRLKILRKAPRDRETHIGHHLSLLWDNPYKVPPDAPSYSNASI